MRVQTMLFAFTMATALAAAAGDPPPPAPPPAAPDGATLWNDSKRAKCATCHGPDGKGDTKMGKQKGVKDMSTAEWQKGHTDQQIIDAILKGVEREENGKKIKMEPLKNGTQDEANALLGFIRTLGPK